MNHCARLARVICAAALVSALAGCASGGVNVGFSLPIGRSAGVGVSVGSDGRIGTSVGVGVGGGSVSVGTSGRLPPASRSSDEKKAEDQ
jgi:hypothetical protein